MIVNYLFITLFIFFLLIKIKEFLQKVFNFLSFSRNYAKKAKGQVRHSKPVPCPFQFFTRKTRKGQGTVCLVPLPHHNCPKVFPVLFHIFMWVNCPKPCPFADLVGKY